MLIERIIAVLVARREAAGIAQVELARRLRVSSWTLWDWEHGEEDPSARALAQWARLLGCEIEVVPGRAGATSAASESELSANRRVRGK